jgi:glycosyltransferase involved in cell wall biosynthesis
MRLLFLNRSFWPDLEATGQLLTELCEDLSQDHEVTVISGPPYHVATSGPGLLRRDRLGKIAIVRTWGTTFPKRNLAGRLVNLATYYLLAVAAALRSGRPDVVIAETDPPLLGVLGAFLRAWWGCRFVYYCQDLYPDIAEATGALRSRALLALLDRANRFAYLKADRIVVPGRDMRRRLIDKGVDAGRIVVVPNWADCRRLEPPMTSSFRSGLGEGFVVMYSGNLGLSQNLDVVLEAAAELRSEAAIHFVLVGEGARKTWLEERVRCLCLTNVRFFPYQPSDRLADSLGAADLHLIPLEAGAAGCLVPSKVYGILAVGRPFVAMMDEDSEVAMIAREHDVGIVVPPGDAPALARAIREAAANPPRLREMGARGRQLAERDFDRLVVTREFATVLETVLDPKGTPTSP